MRHGGDRARRRLRVMAAAEVGGDDAAWRRRSSMDDNVTWWRLEGDDGVCGDDDGDCGGASETQRYHNHRWLKKARRTRTV